MAASNHTCKHGVDPDCARCADIEDIEFAIDYADELMRDRISTPLILEMAIPLKAEAEKELERENQRSSGRSVARTDTFENLQREFAEYLQDEHKYWNLIAPFRKALRAHYACQYNNKSLDQVKRILHILWNKDERFVERTDIWTSQVTYGWDELIDKMDREQAEVRDAPARFWAMHGQVLPALPPTPYTDVVRRIGELCCERGKGRDWGTCLVIIREWLTAKGAAVSSVDSMLENRSDMLRWTDNDRDQLASRFNLPKEREERDIITGFISRRRQHMFRRFDDESREAAEAPVATG